MKDLIARLEATTKGSRELDAEIQARVVDGYTEKLPSNYYNFEKWMSIYATSEAMGGLNQDEAIPEYTISIDDALKLIPENLCWSYDSALNYMEISDLAKSPIFVAASTDDPTLAPSHTPALAICIVALKARQTLGIRNA